MNTYAHAHTHSLIHLFCIAIATMALTHPASCYVQVLVLLYHVVMVTPTFAAFFPLCLSNLTGIFLLPVLLRTPDLPASATVFSLTASLPGKPRKNQDLYHTQ